MPDFASFRFGRKQHDPARVAAVKPHVYGVAPVPLVLPREDLVWKPTLVRNDTLPTCTIAGLINSARVWALLKGYDLVYDEAALLSDYATLAGCAPTPEAIGATEGLQMLSVLEYFSAKGLDIGAQAPLVPDYATVATKNALAIRDAINAHGSAYAGITLYSADMQPGAVWKGAPVAGDAVAGYHCLVPFSFPTPDSFDEATWGEIMQANDEWLLSRLDEAYALTWRMAVAEAA